MSLSSGINKQNEQCVCTPANAVPQGMRFACLNNIELQSLTIFILVEIVTVAWVVCFAASTYCVGTGRGVGSWRVHS